MKKFLLSLVALIFSATFALAQAPTRLCITTNGVNCVEIQGSFPFPVTQSVSASSTSGVTYSSTNALAANSVIKTSAGNLYSFEVSADSTLSGAAWWIIIYDAVAAPADGAITPSKCYAMASGTTMFSAAFLLPIAFTTGIVIGVSTTGCFTKTASTHAFISGDAK